MSDLTPARAYARLVALATLLDRPDELRAREAATVLVDAAQDERREVAA